MEGVGVVAIVAHCWRSRMEGVGVTIANAIATACAIALPGREAVAVGDALWYARRSLPYRRSYLMSRPSKTIVVPISQQKHEFCQIEVERGIVTAFRREAAARETTVPRLIRDLLAIIANDRLTSAILDDAATCSSVSWPPRRESLD